MTKLTLELPDEAEKIQDLDKSIAWFVDEQIRIANWREKQYGDDVESILSAAREDAEKLKSSGMTQEDARAEFLKLWQESCEQ